MNNHYLKYRQKFNIKHTIGEDAPHIHTVDVNLYFRESDDKFKAFEDTQYVLDEFFEKNFDGKLMNDLPAFRDIVPTIENIGKEIYIELLGFLGDIGYTLVKLEIGENPSRLFAVSDFLIKGEISENSTGDEIRIDRYIKENYDEFVEIQERKQKEAEIQEQEENSEKESKKEEQSEVAVIPAVEESVAIEEETILDEPPTRKSKLHALCYVGVAFAAAVLFYFLAYKSSVLVSTGDIYLHLGKGQYLMTELMKGRISPIYMESWYDGYLMFMHCEPLAYYLLAFSGWIFGMNVTAGYIFFLAVVMFIGAYGFIRTGMIYNRPLVGLGAGLLWFFIPEMSRNYYITGDVKILLAVSFLPLLYSYIAEYYKLGKKRILTKMALTVALIVLSDLSVAIVIIIGLLLLFIYRTIIDKKYLEYIKVFLMMLVGVGLSMAWIYSAYANGSIPDFIINKEGFQGEMGIIILLFACFVLGKKNIKYTSIIGMLAGVVSIYFIPQVVYIAYLALFADIIQWKGSRRIFAASILLVTGILCLYNFDFNKEYRNRAQFEQQMLLEESVKESVKKAEEYTISNLLYLDITDTSTYPAYYMTYNNKNIVFSNRSSARYNMISNNISQLKYALYTKNFDYVFDRGLELSCDTFLVYIEGLNYKEKDRQHFAEIADKYNYKTVELNETYAIFHRDLPEHFGVNTAYEGLAVGEKSKSISVMYPYFEEAGKENLLDYSFEELVKYKKIYVSDLKYDYLEKAEELVKKLADAGVDVYIDMDSIQNNPLTNRQVFLGCTAQSIVFKNSYPELYFDGKTFYSKDFYSEYSQWNTVYIENLDSVKGKSVLAEKELAFYGTTYNENVHLLSFNLLYHSVETQDENIAEMLDGIFDLENGQSPERKIINIMSKFDGKSIIIESEEEAILGIAYQKNFEGNENISKINSLVKVKAGSTVINFNYDSLFIGVCITIMVVTITIIINMLLTKQEKRR